jgi:replicative DNA helicase
MTNRLPPQDLYAEQGLLGCVLIYGNMDDIDITPAEFYDRRHGKIFEAMLGLYSESKPIDELTVASRLNDAGQLQTVGGPALLGELASIAVSPAHGVHYANLIRDKARARAFIEAAQEAQDRVYSMQADAGAAIEEAEQLIYKATSAMGATRGPRQLKLGVVSCLESMEKKESEGIPCGFKAIDSMTAGLFPGDLFILAGRPGMGKSALAVQIGTYVAEHVGPAAFFSLEMTENNCVKRILSGEANVPYERIKHQQLTSGDWVSLSKAADKVYGLPFFIDDTEALHHLDLRKRVRRLCSKQGFKLIIVDYLQLMRGSKESREEEISEISRSLKALAKEMNLPVIALAQLNRKCEEREDKRPRLSDLRESGAIEQDADVVAFVYREKAYNENADDIAEVIIKKQRNGPLGTAKLFFKGAMVRFEALGWEAG